MLGTALFLLILYTSEISDQYVLSVKNLLPSIQVLKLVILMSLSASTGREHMCIPELMQWPCFRIKSGVFLQQSPMVSDLP